MEIDERKTVKRKGLAYDVELIARTVVPLTFVGSRSVELAPGQEMTSDAVPATILPHQTMAVITRWRTR